jgi:hypothetical protein
MYSDFKQYSDYVAPQDNETEFILYESEFTGE